MKCSRTMLLLLLVTFLEAFGQKGWFWQNPLPQGNGLDAVTFLNSNLAYAAGKRGMIVRTNDAGSTWSIIPSDVEEELLDILFFNADSGLAVGASGTILRTFDGATTWNRLPVATTATLHAIHAFDDRGIFIAGSGGTILHTIDGGDSWESPDSKTTAELFSIAANTIGDLYAVGAGGVVTRSTDGGNTWVKRANIGATALHSIRFGGANLGLLVGEAGKIYRSVDGGGGWVPIVQTITTANLNQVIIRDATHVFICGDNGTLLSSADAGLSWSGVVSNTVQSLAGISFNGTAGISVGAAGAIINSSNGGSSWQSRFTTVTTAKLRGVSLMSEQVCTAVGDSSGKGMILRSDNYGLSWTVQNRTTNTLFEDCYFTHPDSGFVIGASGTVLRTTNGGGVWNKLGGIPVTSLYGIHFVTSKIGAIVGQSGTILRTINGGDSWSAQTNPDPMMSPLQSVHFSHPDSGVAVGYFGTILRTTNGGATWTKITSGTANVLTSVSFADSDTGVVVGDNSTVLRTTDKGAHWNTISLPGLTGTPRLEFIRFVDNKVGYLSGATGYIFRSEDGGFSWKKLLRTTSNSLNAVSFFDAYVGVAVGDQGTILRTYDGGLPVELISFSGRFDRPHRQVVLEWKTASESNNYGFDIERRTGGEWQTIGFVPGQGTTTTTIQYRFIDRSVPQTSAVQYRLRQMDMDGLFAHSPAIQVAIAGTPAEFELQQNYPNPFNGSTAIRFSLNRPGRVKLQILNNLGQLVQTLIDEEMNIGEHLVHWQTSSLASGVYICRLSTANQVQSRKMLYLQ